MTTINSKQWEHQVPNNTILHDQKQQQHYSNAYTVQEHPHTTHQHRSFSLPHYTKSAVTAIQQMPTCDTFANISYNTMDSDTFSSSYDNGELEQSSLTDDDDVEIIMHNSQNCDNLSNDTGDTVISTGTDCLIPSSANNLQYQDFDSSRTDVGPKGQLLQRQLEYYFSRQNLINDTYLVSQMDPDLFVPIATIAKFKRVMNITTDMDFIISTLRRSSLVTVNDSNTMVRPNISTQRTTVILRDVPEATDKEINQFLKDLKAPPIKNIKKDYANMWYITFGSEEDALKLLHDSRGKLFKGQQVAARMKFEPLVASIQAQKSVQQTETSHFASSVNTSTFPSLGQNQHTATDNNNSKNHQLGYNGHYYYNTYINYGNQYPTSYTIQPNKSYYHTNDNGNCNQIGNGYSDYDNINWHSARGGRKRYYRSNKLANGNGLKYEGNSHSTLANPHNWRSESQAQLQNQTEHRTPRTLDDSLPKIDSSDKSSTTSSPEYSSSLSTFQHIDHSHYKSGNRYRHHHHNSQQQQHQRNGKTAYQSPPWIQKQQVFSACPTNPIIYHPVWPNGSMYFLPQPSISTPAKNSLSASSSTASSRRGSSALKVDKTMSTPLPALSSSSNSETTSTINTPISSVQSSSIGTPTDIIESLKSQNTKPKRKSKWNRKKHNSSSSHSHQVVTDQPDISSMYFPPLPINNNVLQTAVSAIDSMKLETPATSATDYVSEERQADILKTGGRLSKETYNNHEQKSNNTATNHIPPPITIRLQQQKSFDNAESLILCPTQGASRPPTPSLTYADILMKKNDKNKSL